MFIQFFAYGAISPIISLYLKDYMHFSDTQTGLILACAAISALISPLITTFIADRFISAERLLGICNIISSILMFILSFLKNNIFPVNIIFFMFLFVYIFYSISNAPTSALVNAITFHNYSEKRQNYGTIRVWGTIGWIAVAWIFSFLWLKSGGDKSISERFPDALKLSAISSFIVGVYSFTFPEHRFKNIKKEIKTLIPVELLKVIIKPEIIILFILGFFVAIIDKFYFYGTSPFLKQMGIKENMILPAMSLGQLPEIFTMWFIGFLILKLGYKKILIAGLIFEVFRFFAFSIGTPIILILFALMAHGFTYALFFTPCSIFLDSHCNEKARAGVHLFFSIIIGGIASFFGNFMAGQTANLFMISKVSKVINYKNFWMVPFIISIVVLVLALIFFKEKKKEKIKLKTVIDEDVHEF